MKTGKGTDMDKEGLGAYILAKVNIGPAYVGGQFGYSSGDTKRHDEGQDRSGQHDVLDPRPDLRRTTT